MTENEALSLINQVVSQHRGTREDHQKLLEAVSILQKAITKDNKKKK